jgi:hypothetical protein
MDFSKAFDVVAHQRLLLKLFHYGIQGPTLTWIDNFLTRRKQRVVIGGDASDWIRVQSGVPQGTVLGPLLFLLYINDLPDQITSTLRLFADDCVIYRTISNDADADKLQKDLDRLCSWERKWCMKFNTDKCFTLKISTSRTIKQHIYSLNGTVLDEVDSHTYLGVNISSNMKWNDHISQVAAKANRSLGFIKRNLRGCTEDIKNIAFRSLVRPSLEYCAAVWDPYTEALIYQLEAVQRRAARFVKNNYDKRSSVTKMMDDLSWPTLATRRKISRLSLFYKAYEGHLAIPVRKLLHPVTRSTRNTHSKAFIPPQPSKDLYKFSFLPRAVNEWNSLSESTITTPEPKLFKAKLQELYH